MNPAYLAAVEEAFLAHTGRGLMLSPRDVALVERWARVGAPVQVVVDGIAQVFSRPGTRQTRVRSLVFARVGVEAALRAWQSRSAGQAAGTGLDRGPKGISLLVARVRGAAGRHEAPMGERLLRVADRIAALSQASAVLRDDLDDDLTRLEGQILDELWASLPSATQRALVDGVEGELRPERPKMAESEYTVVRAARLRRLTRDHLGLPVFELGEEVAS